MTEQGKKIMEIEDNKDIEIDLEDVGNKVVGGMKLKPLADRVVIKDAGSSEETVGGINLA